MQIHDLAAETIADAEAVVGEVADGETRDRLQMAIIRAEARDGDLPALKAALDRLSTEDRQAALSALIADLPQSGGGTCPDRRDVSAAVAKGRGGRSATRSRHVSEG